VVNAAGKAASRLRWQSAPTLVYVADTIAHGKRQMHYALVAALDPDLPPPLGPLQPPGTPPLKKNQILLADWAVGRRPACPITAEPGAPLTVQYYLPDAMGQLSLEKKELQLAGYVFQRWQTAADDRDLTPRFEGITDQLEMDSWRAPFPYDPKKVTTADHDYW